MKIKDNICSGFFEEFDGNKNYTNLPRQIFPKAYTGNGHIDIVKRETILRGTTFGDIIYAKICERKIDIDSIFDLRMARFEIQQGNELLNFLKEQKNE